MNLTLCDVAPRDGLQNLDVCFSPSTRAELISRLVRAGLPRVEAVSFVNPARVPQMAAAEEVIAELPDIGHHAVIAGLVLNERGLDRLLAAGLPEMHYAFAVTESFNQRNAHMSVSSAVAAGRSLIEEATARGVRPTVTLGASFGCPFEGLVDPTSVLVLAEQLAEAGAAEIVFADTIGVAVPRQVTYLVAEGLASLGVPIGVHLHNTRNTGIANAVAALDAGATTLDASVGGIGGCPFAPRATGNICTEDLVYLLEGQGISTGIDLDALIQTAVWLEGVIGTPLPGQVYRAGRFPPSRT